PAVEPCQRGASSLERGGVLGERDPASACDFADPALDRLDGRARAGRRPRGPGELEGGLEARDPPYAGELCVPADQAALGAEGFAEILRRADRAAGARRRPGDEDGGDAEGREPTPLRSIRELHAPANVDVVLEVKIPPWNGSKCYVDDPEHPDAA